MHKREAGEQDSDQDETSNVKVQNREPEEIAIIAEISTACRELLRAVVEHLPDQCQEQRAETCH